MDYQYENLGHERFQEFCSSLLAKHFPDFQSYPVGQPDGGRDSLFYYMDSPQKDFIVFQVKYVRNPKTIPDIHKWLISILEEEAPKIEKLIPKGAKKFYLLTNVDGTAHLGSGSKDKANSILEEHVKIPSICWWRDDLSRIIEKDILFKWSFPQILNGQDVLNSVLFNNISENKEKRENVIKAYLADQYALDNEVKFRQVDLQNKLLDLYTDVPIKVKKFNSKNRRLKRILENLAINNRLIPYEDSFIIDDRESQGAASFFLHSEIQENLQRILLEGGPGQGKSTISQYLCQVHRARLLNKVNDLKLLPTSIQSSPIRLPFKIDLRHVAFWLENKNPYTERLSQEKYNSVWNKSLESFLVGHIIYHSQIDDFTTGDLIAVSKISPVLLVFDGFDEIANFEIRKEVIDFINKGINRIQENAQSIQVIVTSRPAAFSDSIGFSADLYPHFELADLTAKTTMEYVDKWVKANRLSSREASEIKRLVEEKLKLPHLKELAKSPMQLAIFISLLRTRGESLPNKRTALYDSYIELFFNRESEKSAVIRDHRDLIIDIHQYLAWVLHSEAELLQHSGNIHIDELKERLRKYLSEEEHDTAIADKLFHVMKERVCALVSRVQGTYEFEVQPLREYFCAKFLYNTAPYSPVGEEKNGTKPDRFDAISRNFYWHNVVRFFSGCFDKGELPLLIQKLKELQEDEILKYTNYPRLLTSQILSDWVFTQYPRLLKEVVKIIIEGINIGSIINQEMGTRGNDSILLPNECGRKEVVKESFSQLKSFPQPDYATELINLIKNNHYCTAEQWQEYLPSLSGEKLTKWIEYAYRLGIIHLLDENLLFSLISDSKDQPEFSKRLQIMIKGNRLGSLEKNLIFKELIFGEILAGKIIVPLRRSSSNSFHFLTLILNSYLAQSILEAENSNRTFLNFVSNRIYYNREKDNSSITHFSKLDPIDELINTFKENISPLFDLQLDVWKNSIDPWSILIEKARDAFGDRWQIKKIAVIAAGIRSRSDNYEEYEELHNDKLDLCKRTRCARLKSGHISYWRNLVMAKKDKLFILLNFFTWSTPRTIIELKDELEETLIKLQKDDLKILYDALQETTKRSNFSKSQIGLLRKEINLKKFSDKFLLLLCQRFNPKLKADIIYHTINENNIDGINLSEVKLDFITQRYLDTPEDEKLLATVKELYTSSNESSRLEQFLYRHPRNSKLKLPYKLAKRIMENAIEYPRLIASVAENSCRYYANLHTREVGEVAKEEKWFEKSNLIG